MTSAGDFLSLGDDFMLKGYHRNASFGQRPPLDLHIKPSFYSASAACLASSATNFRNGCFHRCQLALFLRQAVGLCFHLVSMLSSFSQKCRCFSLNEYGRRTL